MRLYLFGAMTGIPDHNRAAFRTAADRLRHLGHEVISPVELDEDSGLDFSRPLTEAEYAACLGRDLALISELLGRGELDGGVGLPGWERSNGARVEDRVIRAFGKQTFKLKAGKLLPLYQEPEMATISPRHPSTDRFHEILESLGELVDRKGQDYGHGSDPFTSVRSSGEWGMPEWVGAMVRATDKVRRLQSFARKGSLANESARDAFLDLAVYAVIALVLYEEETPTDLPPA